MQDTKAVLADFLDRLSAAPASALLLDYDGTLAPFQTERECAYPYPGVLQVLERIIQSGKTRVIVVTGRPIRELRVLFHPSGNLEIWGEHGLEHLLRDGTYHQTTIDLEIAKILAQANKSLIEAGLASLAETKLGGIAIHWRGLSDVEIDRIQTLAHAGWSGLTEQPGIKLLEFDGGLELRVASPNKGDAIAAILDDLEAEIPIAFLGDDVTDEDAFRVLNDRGLSILVRPEYRETRAEAWLKPPHELIEFFAQWVNSISA